jgi:uncharacterized protein YeeX (DUF496 family)
MPESALPLSDAQKNFTPAVKLRFSLWETMITETRTDEAIKRQIGDILKKLRDEGLTSWDNLQLAFASTIQGLEDINQTWKANTSEPAVQALFQNLKKDIDDLKTELFNPAA